MGFSGDLQKFTGDDGFIKKAVFGAEVIGDATTPLPTGTYLVIAVAASSTLPAAVSGGEDTAVSDILEVKAGVTITPAIGDDLVTLTLSDQCDVSSWAMEFTKEEIEVTTFCDDVKKYRAGKADMAGSINGVFTAGVTDKATVTDSGFMRQFLPIVRQDGSTSFDRFAQEDAILLGFFYINNDTNIADEMLVIAPFQLFGQGLGGEIGASQSFASAFRFANLAYTSDADVDVEIKPTFYRIAS